ncbi:hypothetical protein HanIR_Chr07g0306901 [Helianthus annuus]|nr:hypothetical protein HanIR_Chr07g0306901 [Helianthus annuus]
MEFFDGTENEFHSSFLFRIKCRACCEPFAFGVMVTCPIVTFARVLGAAFHSSVALALVSPSEFGVFGLVLDPFAHRAVRK